MSEYFHGDELRKAVYESKSERKFYVQSFIPEHSILMFYAPDGIGKSTLSLQFCVEACSGKPVYGGYDVERPINVMYIMAERHHIEAMERLKLMDQNLKIKWNHFLLTDKLQGYDLLDRQDARRFVEKVLIYSREFERVGGVHYIHIDPIYALISKGLVSEDGASAIRDTLNRIQSELNCSIGYNHHANRGVKNPQSGERSKGDMYGSRFLSAHVTGVFSINQTKEGTKFKCEKDSHRCLTESFNLQYDPENYLSFINPDEAMGNKYEQFLQVLRSAFAQDKCLSFGDINAQINVSHSYLRKAIKRQVELGIIINTKPNGVKALYSVLKQP